MIDTHSARRCWWQRHQWLIVRRTVQLAILALFLAGPWFGYWWVKGNLASSIVLDTVSLSDPYMLLQSLATGHVAGTTAVAGSITVVVVYGVVGGRVYCAWVCPINIVTDVACWLRSKLGLNAGWQPKKSFRRWLFGATIVVSAVTGTIAWENVNPITMLQRGLVFGLGMAWIIVLAVFLFDLIVSRRGWCGHICPVGVFYGVVGRYALVRVSAGNRDNCTDCGDCFRVCPEPQVITPALKGRGAGYYPVILDGDCSNCGACIDVCDDAVFEFSMRYGKNRLALPRD